MSRHSVLVLPAFPEHRILGLHDSDQGVLFREGHHTDPLRAVDMPYTPVPFNLAGERALRNGRIG